MLPHRYFGTFLWHIFSYEKNRCYVDEAANEPFNNVSKKKGIIFHQFSGEVIIVDNARGLRAELFKQLPYDDVYILDKAFTWTYNITHESSCGPYYSEASWTEETK